MKLAIDLEYIDSFLLGLFDEVMPALPERPEEDQEPKSIKEMAFNGPVYSYSSEVFLEDLRRSEDYGNYDGYLITINSPGGDLDSSVNLMTAIRSLNKPVYVYTNQLLSGGLMAALYADKIYAGDKMSQIGSIGVVYSYSPEVMKVMKEYVKQVYSNLSPDKNKEYRQLQEGDEEPLVQKLDTLARMFQDHVKITRNLKGDKDSTLSGSVFYGEQAYKRGLVDGIADYSQVKNLLTKRIAVGQKD